MASPGGRARNFVARCHDIPAAKCKFEASLRNCPAAFRSNQRAEFRGKWPRNPWRSKSNFATQRPGTTPGCGERQSEYVMQMSTGSPEPLERIGQQWTPEAC